MRQRHIPEGLVVREMQTTAGDWAVRLAFAFTLVAPLTLGTYLVLHRWWWAVAALIAVIIVAVPLATTYQLRLMSRAQAKAREEGVYLDWLPLQWRRAARHGKTQAAFSLIILGFMLVGLIVWTIGIKT
jgi:hypothetical protein